MILLKKIPFNVMKYYGKGQSQMEKIILIRVGVRAPSYQDNASYKIPKSYSFKEYNPNF